ncbi:carboxypeptidase-like regulatory domain-containing protein [Cellulophaga fucicola]|nr:carboxypeptidase-like regulatory domain-containing protein [Cellulophaga fucicola]
MLSILIRNKNQKLIMRKTTQLVILIITLIASNTTTAQELNASIKDAASKEAIPYVSVVLSNKKGVITNGEGKFSLSTTNTTVIDSIFISCIGYETIAQPVTTFKDSIIYMQPKTIELNEVLVSNKNYTGEEIIDMVKDSLDKNYSKDLTKKKIFLRESNYQGLDKTNYTFMKSTIKELNKPFLDSVITALPKRDNSYSEVLCDIYGNYDKETLKIDPIKGCRLYDKNSELDITKLEEKFNEIIKKNVKPDSYFKIKSGLLGVKVDGALDNPNDVKKDSIALKKELEEKKKLEEARRASYATYKKTTIGNQFSNLFYMDDAKLNVITKSGRYNFTIKDYTYWGNIPVYILNFEPKRGADYEGTIYVNADDFAVIRIDYDNVKTLKSIKLFGISYQEHLSRGKMIFAKNENNTYDLQYLEREAGNKAGIRRPLKIIEKNKVVKGRNKQNELYVKLDMAITSVTKYEIVVFDAENISKSIYDNFKEDKVIKPEYLRKYDPEFWKGYNIIEPNQAIREFTAEE